MAGTYRTLILTAWLWCVSAFSAPPPKPVSISGSQVWTNDGTIHPNANTNYPGAGPDNFQNWLFDGVFVKLSRSGPHLQVTMGSGEYAVVDAANQLNTTAIDIYGYPNGDGTFTAAIAIGLDTVYGDCVLIDPNSDNGVPPFKFYSGTNNVIAARSVLYAIGNAHTNKVIVLGDGTIESTALAVKTNYVPANFVPIVGSIFFVGSNNALYSVSTTKTNLIGVP